MPVNEFCKYNSFQAYYRSHLDFLRRKQKINKGNVLYATKHSLYGVPGT